MHYSMCYDIGMFCLNSNIREMLGKNTWKTGICHILLCPCKYLMLFSISVKKKTVCTQTLSNEKIKDKRIWIQRHRALKEAVKN